MYGNLSQMILTTQIIESLLLLALIAVVSFLIMHVTIPKRFDNRNVKIDLSTFQTGIGWGFHIFIDSKFQIDQFFIPVIETHLGFPTREIAEMAGQIVIEKFKRNERLGLTISDLTTAGIVIDNALLVGKEELKHCQLN